MYRLFVGLSVLGMVGVMPMSAQAQSRDISPTMIIESGPSDMPGYRRMVFVKYLSGDRVTTNYKAYNRSEFRQVPDTTPREAVMACTRGGASSLSDIQAFERAERERARRGQAPEIVSFCIKGVSNWQGGNRDRFTDPIFNGMPYAASLK